MALRPAVAVLSLLGAASASAGDLPEHRMVHRRAADLVRRQAVSVSGAAAESAPAGNGNGGNNGGNGNGGNNATPTTATTASPNDDGGIVAVISSVLDPRVTVTAPVPTVTLPASSARAAPTSKAASVGPTVVQITQTSTAIPSVTASVSAAAASASTTAAPSSSGIGHGTLIAIIVVASCIGGALAIWTIIRKWKLAPSRRFEDKLQPVDFFNPGNDARAGAGFDTRLPPAAGGLARADSQASSGYGGVNSTTQLVRADSLGSATGSQRGAKSAHGGMSEASYAQGPYGYRPAAAYPPAIAPGQQPFAPQRGPGALANPYQDYDSSYGAAAPGGGYARY